jgi:hypothetical protein
MTTVDFTARWYTLIRYRDVPTQLTAVAQAKTAAEAHLLAATWAEQYPGDTTLIFDPENTHLAPRELLEHIVRAEQADTQAESGQPHQRAAASTPPGPRRH